MISLNDVLLAMSNIPVDDPIAEIWGRGLQGGYKIIKYTGTFPITITANGDALIDYRIYGADGGVGERTENLLNPNIVDEEQEIKIEGGTKYTISRYVSGTARALIFATYDENGNKLWNDYLGEWYRKGFVTDANAVLLKVYIPARFKNAASMVKGYESTPTSDPYPTNYIPYGYKLPMIVNNGITNIVPPAPAETKTLNGITISSDGKGTYTISGTTTEIVSIVFNINSYTVNSATNTIAFFNTFTQWDGFSFLFAGRNFGFPFKNRVLHNIANIGTYNTIAFAIFPGITISGTVSPLLFDGVNITPTEFVPYTPPIKYDVPVYIGENQLTEVEYVDYGEQKIYRDVGGTLTPTDSPVPLPEIPTIKGATVIDYDGDPKPSQMYVKYKGKSGDA